MVLVLDPEDQWSDAEMLSSPGSKHDTRLRDDVIRATGPEASPRLREVLPALITHLHGFAREVNLTVDEWFAGIELVSANSGIHTNLSDPVLTWKPDQPVRENVRR
jgi:hypothetical protein